MIFISISILILILILIFVVFFIIKRRKSTPDFTCPKCGGEMFFNGGRCKDYPQTYCHTCSNCRFEVRGIHTSMNTKHNRVLNCDKKAYYKILLDRGIRNEVDKKPKNS